MPLAAPAILRAAMKIISSCLGLVLLISTGHAETSLTIYNQDFGVVRETLPLDLKAGENHARFSGATAQVEEDSVILRDPAGQVQLTILEQNYRAQVVSTRLLLNLHEGKEIDFYVKESNKPDRVVKGKIIRAGGESSKGTVEPLIEVEGKTRLSLPGEPLFPPLEDDSILKPTLEWQLHADKAAKLDAQLCYVTKGVSWEATYNVVGQEKGEVMDLTGSITVANRSGTDFKNASLQLVAGDVAKLERNPLLPEPCGVVFDYAVGSAPVERKALDEFHLYTLPRPTTIHDKETKQVEFVRGSGVVAKRRYIYDGVDFGSGGRDFSTAITDSDFGTRSQNKVTVVREITNSEANHLGMPLPKGRVRFYRQDADGRLQFTGEDEIDHTAKDEVLVLKAGAAFDLVGERKQTEFKNDPATGTMSETFEIKVRNRKEQDTVEIEVVEHLYRWRQWEVRNHSDPYMRDGAQTIRFKVSLKPGEEKVIRYTAHYAFPAQAPTRPVQPLGSDPFGAPGR